MLKSEFVAVFLWVLGPPLAIGIGLLKLLLVASTRRRNRRFLTAAFFLVVIAAVVALAFVAFGPSWAGRHLGIQDVKVFGVQTIWAPFAYLAVVVAFPFSAWWIIRAEEQ